MKITSSLCFFILIVSLSCKENKTASEILQRTIDSIDTIETICYKQDMNRSDPQNIRDTIYRFREMYFKRLTGDSVVGVKGHWYMYVNDRKNAVYEDIYDGNRLIRKNNRDSVARIFDLVKYPDFKKNHFWSHNTPFGMQYEFKYMLENADSYSIKRLNDTSVNGQLCYQILIGLEDKTSMPGFATRLGDEKGSISRTRYYIDKKTYFPAGMKGERYSTNNPEQKTFIDQKYYDIMFNPEIDEEEQFNTSGGALAGFEITEMKPE